MADSDYEYIELCKDTIRFQLELAFDELPPIKPGGKDIEGLHRIIAGVVRALEVVPIHAPDAALQHDVFTFAFAKLPDAMRRFFALQYEDHCLYSLFNFLRLEIQDYRENNHLLLHSEEATLYRKHRLLFGSWTADPKDINYDENYSEPECAYCRENGHWMRKCPEVGKLFCYRCYSYGHTQRRCKAGPFFVMPTVSH